MLPRFLLFLALFACAIALAASTAEDNVEGSGQEHEETLKDEPLKDEPVDAKDVNFSEFAGSKNRDKRQMGWRFRGYNPFGSYGSFYRYNPWTGTTSTGWYNPLGGARAISGFGPYGVPFAFNNAYLYG